MAEAATSPNREDQTSRRQFPMTGTPQERLAWLESNQPRNLSAINSLRRSLNLQILVAAPKKTRKPLVSMKPAKKASPLYPFSKGYIQRQMRQVTIHY